MDLVKSIADKYITTQRGNLIIVPLAEFADVSPFAKVFLIDALGEMFSKAANKEFEHFICYDKIIYYGGNEVGQNKVYSFAEKKDLNKCEYGIDKTKKPKLFISYPHGSKKIINKLIDEFERVNLNPWVFSKEILPGDNIFGVINNETIECDLLIFFISRATLSANFVKYELNITLHNVIQGNSNWFIVKLDDVNPNDIFSGMTDYLYYDYSADNDITHLATTVQKKLKRL